MSQPHLCNKECKNKLSLSQHIKYCRQNPNYVYIPRKINENKEISRLHTPNWVNVYHENKKEPIEFRENDDYFYISGVGFFGGGFAILDKNHFDLMDEEDKKRFFSYGKELENHLNTLFINKKFEYSKRYEFTDDEE